MALERLVDDPVDVRLQLLLRDPSERLVGVLVARTRAPLARFSERNFSPAHYAAISQRLDATAFIDELRADWDQRSAACPAHHGKSTTGRRADHRPAKGGSV